VEESANAAPRRRLLMVAYHFPPLAGSSGIQRTLRFVQHLPSLGWDPVVLSAHPRAFESVSDDLMREIPSHVHVKRAFALNSARHLAIRGRYLACTARPDRWVSWWMGAVPAGLDLIRRYRIDALWTTYPIATAHLIGATLQRLSGLPWVADFRDPMAQDGYPEDAAVWRSFKRIEERVFRRASACTFTTPGALKLYEGRYGRSDMPWLRLIENGYDEDSFGGTDDGAPPAPLNEGKLTILHSGVVYPSERDPSQLMIALGELRRAQPALAQRVMLRFRAPSQEKLIEGLMQEHGVGDMVEVLPPVPYRAALQEMQAADGLLLLQASSCAAQVPAKYYEYLRAGRPILALTDAAGDTAGIMRRDGLRALAPLDDARAIYEGMLGFILDDAIRLSLRPSSATVMRASRRARSTELARLLDDVTARTNDKGRAHAGSAG
jgi:hypothetical protein